MSEALKQIQLKLMRADEHIQEVHRAITAFLGQDERTFIHLSSPEQADLIRREQEGRVVDPCISVLTGEVLYQLRSSLDHMVCALIEKDGNRPTLSSQFPILKKEPTKPKEIKRYEAQVAGISSPEARASVERHQPYRGTLNGNVLLRLQSMSNHDKHRALMLHVVTASEGRLIEATNGTQTITTTGPILGPTAYAPATLQEALAGAIELQAAEEFTVTKTEAYMTVFVAFSDWSLGQLPVPVFDGLSGMHRSVSDIVHSLAAHL